MKLLAIETSGTTCSAALSIAGALHQRIEEAPRRHADLILPMIRSLLAEAELNLGGLDALAYGCGPGSFTGVRIAAAVTQGLAFAGNRPVIGVSTLAALAHAAWRLGGEVQSLCALDARMAEVYWGAYRIDAAGIPRVCVQDQVAAPGRIALPAIDNGGRLGDWCGVGSGWSAFAEALKTRLAVADMAVARVHGTWACEARDVAAVAAADFNPETARGAAEALPVYLRERVAEPPA
jgi:tRNA threonylcarbamoyladenosine biosynthesis protein TsaB